MAPAETKASEPANAVGSAKKAIYTRPEEMQVVVTIGCKRGKDFRRMEVLPKGPGCELRYHKFDQFHEIASAANGVNFCKEKLERVQSNLEKAGFACE